jgi:WXXGXW repeat (2 copies)
MRTYLWFRSLLIALGFFALSTCASAQVSVGISVGFAPPELPVYEQPICPQEGYIWTPGFWAWDGDDYYWVPGTWVPSPEVGYFWTPPYWGWGGSGFIFHEGYWGPEVGFYGGINYGYGYFGHGYEGGRWDNGHFFYNREVNNVNVTVIHNVYNTRIVNRNETRISYNGGHGGIDARPSSQEEAAARGRHIPPVAVQTQHIEAARNNPQFRASENHGRPPIAATPKPAAFNEHGVVPTKSAGNYNPPPRTGNNPAGANATHTSAPNSNAPRPNPAIHPKDLPPHDRPAPPNTGNPKVDQKYQQQQEKLYQKQQQDHQKLQQKQDQEHQREAKQQADEARKQQTEQRHQQQTQQMEQKHTQQQQKMTQHQQPPPHQAAPPPHEPAPHEAQPKHNNP